MTRGINGAGTVAAQPATDEKRNRATSVVIWEEVLSRLRVTSKQGVPEVQPYP